MPGLYGIVAPRTTTIDAERAASMASALRHETNWTHEKFVAAAGNCIVGQVALPQFAERRQIAADSDVIVALEGEILNRREIAQEPAAPGERSLDARFVADGYRRDGARFFSRLEGKFVLALWDEQRREFLLVSDRFGMKPTYYSCNGGVFTFVAEIRALAAFAGETSSLDVAGVALFLSFGQLIGDATMIAGVRVLPAATVLRFAADTSQLTLETYWRPEPAAALSGGAEAALERLDAAFAQAVERSVRDTPHLGIALSGGLDGRTILAAVNHRTTPIESLCLGMPGSLDHDSAAKISRLTNGRHHQLLLDQHFLERYPEYLRWMVGRTDGHYLDQGIVVPTLARYRELGVDVLLRGHAGELFHLDKAYNFSVDESFARLEHDRDLFAWCASRLSAYMLDGLDRPLFRALDLADLRSLAERTLADCWAESSYLDSKFNRLTHLFLAQRTRRETAMSMTIFGSVVETRIPYLDRDVVEAVMAVPGPMRLGDRIQSHIIARRNPALLKVVNANTGARMGAPKWLQRATTFRMKVLGKLGVKGYQPYERLGSWLRHELRPFVHDVLLSERCLERGLFLPDTIRRIVEQHESGTRNFTYLIQALMIIELGQRLAADPKQGADLSPAERRAVAGAAAQT